MTEEFNLSKKIRYGLTTIRDGFTNEIKENYNSQSIEIEDVKEFIRLLKEELELNWKHYQYNYNQSGSLKRKIELFNKIDKLAGKSLI